MPTRGKRVLVDTSVAIPLLVVRHEDHARSHAAVAGRMCGLSGHAAFETYSVLTRMPVPYRLDPTEAALAVTSNFPATVMLSADRAARLLDELAQYRIAGGAVYDALVGAAAAEHRLPLLTSDSRALSVYRSMGVTTELVAAATT